MATSRQEAFLWRDEDGLVQCHVYVIWQGMLNPSRSRGVRITGLVWHLPRWQAFPIEAI